MAASRSMLEALLARVQKRAQEPRAGAIHIPPLPVPEVGEGAHDSAETLPPQAAAGQLSAGQPAARQQPPPLHQPPELELVEDEEDIEEYDEELIEIIDDADVIPQAAAAARAIEPSAFGANLERRGGPPNGKSSVPAAAAAAAAAAPAALATPGVAAPAARAVTTPPEAAEPLRPEAVAARPVAPSPVVHTRSVRRELRATPFLELLDASLKLGG